MVPEKVAAREIIDINKYYSVKRVIQYFLNCIEDSKTQIPIIENEIKQLESKLASNQTESLSKTQEPTILKQRLAEHENNLENWQKEIAKTIKVENESLKLQIEVRKSIITNTYKLNVILKHAPDRYRLPDDFNEKEIQAIMTTSSEKLQKSGIDISKLHVPEKFICEILKEIMTDPVHDGDSEQTYERIALDVTFRSREYHPSTYLLVTAEEPAIIKSATELEQEIDSWVKTLISVKQHFSDENAVYSFSKDYIDNGTFPKWIEPRVISFICKDLNRDIQKKIYACDTQTKDSIYPFLLRVKNEFNVQIMHTVSALAIELCLELANMAKSHKRLPTVLFKNTDIFNTIYENFGLSAFNNFLKYCLTDNPIPLITRCVSNYLSQQHNQNKETLLLFLLDQTQLTNRSELGKKIMAELNINFVWQRKPKLKTWLQEQLSTVSLSTYQLPPMLSIYSPTTDDKNTKNGGNPQTNIINMFNAIQQDVDTKTPLPANDNNNDNSYQKILTHLIRATLFLSIAHQQENPDLKFMVLQLFETNAMASSELYNDLQVEEKQQTLEQLEKDIKDYIEESKLEHIEDTQVLFQYHRAG